MTRYRLVIKEADGSRHIAEESDSRFDLFSAGKNILMSDVGVSVQADVIDNKTGRALDTLINT